MNFLRLIIFSFALFQIPASFGQIRRCEAALNESSTQAAITSLASLRLQLDLARSQGSSLVLRSLEQEFVKKQTAVSQYLESNHLMTQAQLRASIKAEILKLQSENDQDARNEEKQKEEVKTALAPIALAKKMVFHDIRPGKFTMGKDNDAPTEITEPFAMMETPVTQMMWARLKIIMGETDPEKINPSHFKTDEEAVTVNILGVEVPMKPDHPVEMVSWNDVAGPGGFIEGLNQLSNSEDPKIQDFLQTVIPGHQRGDHYDLPSEAQWEFVKRNRGQANKAYFDKEDDSELAKYAWYEENSGDRTHAVAQLQPRIVDGKPFYDLEGNVWHWVKDFFFSRLSGGKDPAGPVSGSRHVIRGGCWGALSLSLRSTFRTSADPGVANSATGFRLVRTRL